MRTDWRTIRRVRPGFDLQLEYAGQTYRGSPNALIFPGVSTCVTGNVATDPTDCADPVPAASDFNVFSVNQNFRTPYFFNYNLNVQKSFGNGLAVWQVGYVGSEGRKLSVMLDINQIPGTLTDGNLTAVSELRRRSTNSTASAPRTTTHCRARCGCARGTGLTSQFAYTWAHELDEISAYRGAIPLRQHQPEGRVRQWRFRYPPQFLGTFTWDIPGSDRMVRNGSRMAGRSTV